MFLIIFSLVLLLLTIFSIKRKKFLFLFIPCMLFLPDYYGIEFSKSLPILTISRLMTIVLFIYAYFYGEKKFKKISLQTFPKAYLFLAGYFVLRIISNVYYIPKHSHAIKMIFSIIIEQLFVIIALYRLNPNKKEIDTLINVIVWSAFSLFIIGVLESLTFIRPFDQLYTVHRFMLNEHYIRLGLLRSVTTMAMPGFYSNMCLLVLPLTLYLYNKSYQKRYLLVCVADIFAAIHSGSRAAIFYFFLALLFYSIFFIHGKDERIRCLKNTLLVLLTTCLIASILSIMNPRYKYFYTGSAKAFLNELGCDFDLDAGAPEGVDGYGKNYDPDDKFHGGVGSRKLQFSGIIYALIKNPVFGLGNGAIDRNELLYYDYGKWNKD